MESRREFIKKSMLGTAGLAMGSTMNMSAKSYARIIGANDRMGVAIIGLGRRLSAFIEPIAIKESNVQLIYLCDVMEKQRTRAMQSFAEHIDYKAKLENDLRKVIADKQVDAVFNATPDHWHTPGSIMAMKAGKHVYVEKPCSHNMFENEMLVGQLKNTIKWCKWAISNAHQCTQWKLSTKFTTGLSAHLTKQSPFMPTHGRKYRFRKKYLFLPDWIGNFSRAPHLVAITPKKPGIISGIGTAGITERLKPAIMPRTNSISPAERFK